MQFLSLLSSQRLLAGLSSWKIGGVAEYFAKPRNVRELQTILSKVPDAVPLTVIGNATNVLFRRYLPGVCLHFADLRAIRFLSNATTKVLAGMPLAHFARLCCKNGLDASPFTGIPGTIGGALMMNAGAYGDNIWQHVVEITTIDRQGNLHHYSDPYGAGFHPAYRTLTGMALNEWFLAATLRWASSDVNQLTSRVIELQQRRRLSQPLEYPNAGSVFRNPPNDYAARLIESAGLKGNRCGDAQISEKHANFIINLGKATAEEVETLMQLAITTVEAKYGLILQPEIKILGTN